MNRFSRATSFLRTNLTTFISLSLGFSGLLFGASTWNVWSTYQAFDAAIAKQFKLQSLSDRVVYLDEVLTMSALMAASTGDLKWENRYNQFLPELDSTIKQVTAQVPDAYNANAKQTDAANLKLVELETRSFQLIRQGQAPQALDLLSGSSYKTQKQIYAQGISTTLDALRSETEASLLRYRQLLLQSLVLACTSFPILVATAIIIVRRVRGYVQERDQAQLSLQELNQQLESRVEKRTEDLKSANVEISHLNERLKEENLRMGAELDVTRRLQQMILPPLKELQLIQDLDIAGFMEPASEVGGDYYDVLSQNGHIKIAIGDVTGHGLESGVFMLMAQTAVRTLTALQEKDSIRFLTALNTALYDNAQRMQSHKNMSLLLIDYFQGKLSIVGQHEEVILVRQKDNSVERIDTIDLGFPIALEPDIGSFIMQAEIDLEPGDVVVLYTDGITEAENQDQHFYGLDRLCQIIKEHSQESSQSIQEAIIQDVRQFIGLSRVYDDITLVVLKRRNSLSSSI